MSVKLFCEKCAKKAVGHGNAVAVPQHKWLSSCYGCGPCKSQAYEVIPRKKK